MLWLMWSSVFFAAGWVLVGLPLIALGERARQMPVAMLLAVGWLGGMMLLLLPNIIVRWSTPQVHYVPFTWEMLLGWPSLEGALGAVTVAVYRVLLSRWARLQTA